MNISNVAMLAFAGALATSANAQTEVQSILFGRDGAVVLTYHDCHEQKDIAGYLKQKFNQEKTAVEGLHGKNRATLYADPTTGSYSIVTDVDDDLRLNKMTFEQLDQYNKATDSMACRIHGEESGYPDQAKTTDAYKSVFGPK